MILLYYVVAVFAAPFVAVLLVWAHVRYWSERLGVAMSYDVEERLPTDDGSAIELRRVGLPEGVEMKQGLPPVMLVHGLASSHRNHDAWPRQSLARALAADGRDVWLLTLRSGLHGWQHRTRAKVNLDAMAAFDLERGARGIAERTGSPVIDYVGFSMGGMLLYAAMVNRTFRRRIHRVVTIGSPGTLVPRLPLWRVVRLFPVWLVPRMPLRFLSRLAAFASDWMHTPLHAISCNPRNFEKGAMGRALVNCIEDVPRSLMREFARSSFSDGTLRFEGKPVLEELGDVETPALFIAGSVDRLAPVMTVKMAFQAWGARCPATVKELVLLGKAHGQIDDYGHGDLSVGARIAEEVFPLVAAFLAGIVVPTPGGDRSAGAESDERVATVASP